MLLPEVLPIQPFTRPLLPLPVALPGSKSITNRALLLAALADGPVVLTGALFSRDTRIMVKALQQLGFEVVANETALTISVQGRGGEIPKAEATIHIGNAGTAARFLTAFLALRAGGTYHLDGDPAMRERPMGGLLEALVTMGAADAEFHGKPGHFPFTLRTKGLPGGSIPVDASASSQILSALLMVAPYAKQPSTFVFGAVRPSFVGITLNMMRQFGVDVPAGLQGGEVTIPSGCVYRLPSGVYAIEPDATAASYFAALPLAVGGSTLIPGLSRGLLQGDTAFLDVIAKLGVALESSPEGLKVSAAKVFSCKGLDEKFSTFSDTFLTLAALAPLLPCPLRISGITHTRKQETDRVHGMATELSKLIGPENVTEEDDSLTIRPALDALRLKARAARAQGRLIGIETYEDHRFAMSFGILGSHDLLGDGQPWLEIHDPACCGKTFPHFFQVLENLRVHSHTNAAT